MANQDIRRIPQHNRRRSIKAEVAGTAERILNEMLSYRLTDERIFIDRFRDVYDYSIYNTYSKMIIEIYNREVHSYHMVILLHLR